MGRQHLVLPKSTYQFRGKNTITLGLATGFEF